MIDRDIEDIRRDVEINYLGSINIVKAAMPYLQQSQGGILLFTSSSYTRGRSLYSTYSSAKAGIVNLTQALAEELAFDKIRINVINPERTRAGRKSALSGNCCRGIIKNAVVRYNRTSY